MYLLSINYPHQNVKEPIYNKKYIHMYVTFNNWTEFQSIVNDDIEMDVKLRYRRVIRDTMKDHTFEVDLGWKHFFDQVSPRSTD